MNELKSPVTVNSFISFPAQVSVKVLFKNGKLKTDKYAIIPDSETVAIWQYISCIAISIDRKNQASRNGQYAVSMLYFT